MDLAPLIYINGQSGQCENIKAQGHEDTGILNKNKTAGQTVQVG